MKDQNNKKEMKNNKKAQVSAFIIIGLVIVIVAVLLLVFRTEVAGFFKGAFSPEKQTVQIYIEDCLGSTSTEAVTMLGLQGGYLELPMDLQYSDPLNPGYIPPPPSPLKIPLWWYNGKDYMPTLERMESELSRRIGQTMGDCLNNFEAFADQFKIEKEGEQKITAKINPENIGIELNQPIKITQLSDGNEIILRQFTTTVHTKLGKMYDLAKSIMNYENDNAFLEDLTMDLIAMAGGGNNSVHMPLEGWDIDCAGNEWSIQFDLIPDLQQLIKYNFHFLTFDKSIKDYIGEENPRLDLEFCEDTDEDLGICREKRKVQGRYLDYYESFYNLDTSQRDFPDIKVSTVYDKMFGMSMKVEPSDGDRVKSFSLPVPLVGQCINIYHHRYDIKYPIMFTLTDEAGFNFNFGTQVSIDNNEPKRYVHPFSSDEYTYSPSSEDYCQNRVFDRDVFTIDKTTNEHIPGINIRYECVQFGCDLGKTGYPVFQGIELLQSNPFLTTKFPPCINGFLIASGEGYKDAITQVTIDGTSASINPIMMTPVIKINASLVVAEYNAGQINLRPLAEDETAFISINNLEEDHQSTTFLPTRLNFTSELEFIYGDLHYTLDIKIVKNGQPIGGLLIDDWDVNKGQLSTAQQLRVYALTTPEPPKDQDEFIKLWQNLVLTKSEDFMPSFR